MTLPLDPTPGQAEQDEEAQHTLQENSEQVIREVMTEQDRAAVADLEPKMRTTLAFNHVMRKHSHNAALVMTHPRLTNPALTPAPTLTPTPTLTLTPTLTPTLTLTLAR